MIDLVSLLVKAGDGGIGKVAFRREKYVPKGGPNGGRGGDGGNVIIRATKHLNTLGHLSGVKRIEAKVGQAGGKKDLTGRNGDDEVIEVPVGTIVWQVAGNEVARRRQMGDGSLRQPLFRREVKFKTYELEAETMTPPARQPDSAKAYLEEHNPDLYKQVTSSLKNIDLNNLEKTKIIELNQDGQELVLAQGGFGGQGNAFFKSPSRTTPLIAHYGTHGEERLVFLELRLLADAGLVGLPNAGKSTLLNRVTKANSRVDSYPFTTLSPQLGVWQTKQGEVVLADIPGLIEGASKGQGLGYDFLRHVRACRVLVFMLYLPEEEIFAESFTTQAGIKALIDQYKTLTKEVETYDASMRKKPRIIVLNKRDLYSDDLVTAFPEALKKQAMIPKDTPVVIASTATGIGLDALEKAVAETI